MSVKDVLHAVTGCPGPVCLALGFFDGVHRGHVHVLQSAISRASASGGTAWMVTFEPHPSLVLRPQDAPALLMSLAQKIDYARMAGASGGVALPFNRDVARQSPEAFLEDLVAAVPGLSHVAVGAQWRFGFQRAGSVETLKAFGSRHGFTVEGVDAVMHGEAPVSSTRIRNAIIAGDLSLAEIMLGRPVSLRGRVESGRQLGRRLGYPTANLDIPIGVMPPFGIYAARAAFQGRVHDGVVSYGVRPTVDGAGSTPVFELHLFDFTQDLYGAELEVYLHGAIRAEQTFESLEALRDQIRMDCDAARSLLHGKNPKDYLYNVM